MEMLAKQNWNNIGLLISSFQEDDQFTDIELMVDGQIFKGHKVILAAASPYFRTMFSTQLCEKDKICIKIHSIKKELFALIFDYIYNRKFEINEDNVQEILDASNMLQLDNLTNSCCDFLMKKLNDKNVIYIYRLADLYSSTESLLNLKRQCKFYIELNFLKIIDKKKKEFLDLPFHLFETLIKSESLNIHNELDVFKVTLNWILKDPDQRIKHIYLLMRYIRLPIIREDKKSFIVENIKNDVLRSILREILEQDQQKDCQSNLIRNGDDQSSLIASEITKTNNNDELKNLVNLNLRWKPRITCSNFIYLTGGIINDTIASNINRIDSFNFKFTQLKRLSVARCQHQTCELNGLLYIAGGASAIQDLNLVESFDPYDNEKLNISFMLYSRKDFGLVNCNDYLLAIGGSHENPNSIERYDPKTNKWSIYDSIPDLPVAGFRVVKVNELIFIIGGRTKHFEILNQMLSYNPETKEVRKLKGMNKARSSFGCAFMNGFIYAIGGLKNTLCERYSIQHDNWSYISQLDKPVANSCVTVAFNRILMIGGKEPIGSHYKSRNKIDSYDPELNRWSKFKEMQFEICDASLVRL